MGLAPHATQAGDGVFLIAGCDVPLILRNAVSSGTRPRSGEGEDRDPIHIHSEEDGHHLFNTKASYRIVGNTCECAALRLD